MKKKDKAPETMEEQQDVQTSQEPTEEAQPQEEERSIEEWRQELEEAVSQRDAARAALDAAKKERDDYLDSLKRSQADFQNFRRRNQTTRAEGYSDGVCETLLAALPTIDNLERALDAAKNAGENESLINGVQMTLTQFLESMKKFGLEEVPAKGEKFDPELHNAVMREEGGEPGMVLEVLQKGYRVKDKIIRYAMVKVSAE
ncbi:MAG: nucleotide exchange factor GrpE [Eubacteriales bacterium]|nr:nucleotide exchange factor GrpE [Eubacteriales bacterium]